MSSSGLRPAKRIGSNGSGGIGGRRPATSDASSWALAGAGAMPLGPWPVAKYSPSNAPRPISGRPSTEFGRKPVQISWTGALARDGTSPIASFSSQASPPAVKLAS